MLNAPLIASLHLRGLTQSDLAGLIGSSRAHVCQVLAGVPGRGGRTRKKLAALLTPRELSLLGWDTDGRIVRVFHGECSKKTSGAACPPSRTPILDSFRRAHISLHAS